MIGTHNPSPDVELPETYGEHIALCRSSKYPDESAAMPGFYRSDCSFPCAVVVRDFRETELLSSTDNVDAFGIPLGGCSAHKRFIPDDERTIPLVSDSTDGERYGLVDAEWEHHNGARKRALITSADFRPIQYPWQPDDADQDPSVDKRHQTVDSLAEPPA